MKMICQKKIGVSLLWRDQNEVFFFSTDQVKLSALGGYTPIILSKGIKNV